MNDLDRRVARCPLLAPWRLFHLGALLSTMLADGDELGEWGFAALVEADWSAFVKARARVSQEIGL